MKAREALAQEDLTEVSRGRPYAEGMLKKPFHERGCRNSSRFGNGRAEWRTGRAEALFERLDRSLSGIMPEVETHLAEVRA